MFLKLHIFYVHIFYSGPIAESPKPSPVATISSLKEKIRSPFAKGKENTRKIQLMLEETLTKNVQLQRVNRLNMCVVETFEQIQISHF